jgi:hypothetical protein
MVPAKVQDSNRRGKYNGKINKIKYVIPATIINRNSKQHNPYDQAMHRRKSTKGALLKTEPATLITKRYTKV